MKTRSFGNLQNAATAGSVHSFTPAMAQRDPSGYRRAARAWPPTRSGDRENHRADASLVEVSRGNRAGHAAGGGGLLDTPFPRRGIAVADGAESAEVFLQLFGEGDTPQERATINTRTNSLLDLILEGTKSLKGNLGNGTGRSRRISRERSRGRAPNAEGGGERSVRVHDSRGSRGRTGRLRRAGEVDVRPGRARVSGGPDAGGVLHHGRGRHEPDYNHIGVPDSFHPVSHHANDLTRIEKLAKIQTWHLEQFAGFVKKMAETPDGQGSLLDHSIFIWIEHEQQR